MSTNPISEELLAEMLANWREVYSHSTQEARMFDQIAVVLDRAADSRANQAVVTEEMVERACPAVCQDMSFGVVWEDLLWCIEHEQDAIKRMIFEQKRDRVRRIARAALTAALSRAEGQEPVAVKPLEWRAPTDRPDEMEDIALLIADGIGGHYAISPPQTVGPKFLLWWAHDPFYWTGYDTPEAAKAAAQADYEQRIRSALVKAPAPAMPDGWRATVIELEAACEALATSRSHATYLAMIDVDRAGDALQRLDIARSAVRAMLSAAPLQPVATHRHKKSGGEYVLLGIGKMQAKGWWRREVDHHGTARAADVDMHPVAMYQSTDDGSLWARPIEEWEDGRFEEVK